MAEKEQPLESDDSSDASNQKSLLRRFRPLVILFALIALLPSLLTMLQWHRMVLQMASPEMAEAMQYDNMTTHWWSAVKLRNLTVQEVLPSAEQSGDDVSVASGDRAIGSTATHLLTAKSVTSDQPLWKLLLSMGRNSSFTVDDPVVSVRTVGQTTNIEATLTEMFGASDSDESSESFPVAVTINNGTVRLLKPTDEQRMSNVVTLSEINGRFSSLDTTGLLPEISLSANVVSQESDRSPASALASTQSRSVNPRIAANLDQLNTDFPMIPFEVNQLQQMEQADGQQSIQIDFTKDKERAGVHHLSVELSRLQLDDLKPLVSRLVPDMTIEGRVSCLVQAHVLQNQSDSGFAGRFQMSGTEIFARHHNWDPTEAIRLGEVTAGGVIGMAGDGVLVKDFQIRSPLLNMKGDGQVKVAAVDPVKTLRRAADRSGNTDPALLAESEALSAGEVTVNGKLDLAELCRMLPNTIQLVNDLQVDQAEIDFSCRIRQQPSEMLARQLSGPARPGFQWQIAAESSEFSARQAGQRLQLQAPLRIDAMGPLTMDSVSLGKARLSGDFGDLAVDPVDQGFAIQGKVNPDRLHENLSQLLVLPPIGLSGDIDVAGTMQWSEDGAIKLTAVQVEGDDLLVTSPQLTIQPSASALRMLDGQLQLKTRTATIRTLLAPWHDASWLGADSRLQAVVQCEPQSIDVQALLEPLRGGQASTFAGQFSNGGFSLDHARARFQFAADSSGTTYAIRQGVLELPGVQVDISGQLALVEDLVFADIVANTQYDLDVLLGSVLEVDRQLLTLQGQQQQPISVQGCLSAWSTEELQRSLPVGMSSKEKGALQPLSVAGSVRWDSGQLMGLDMSPGMVNATFKEGMVRTDPISCGIGTGTVNAMVQYNVEQSRLQFAPGSQVQNLELNEQFSKQWLGYAIPLLGDAANVRGHLSCRVNLCDYDLMNSGNSRIEGTLDIHDARATTGPSANSLMSALAALDRNAADNFRELVLPAQQVRVQMQSGQIAHDQLIMQLGKYEITSRGIVTMDQRLNLSLTVPVSEQAARYAGSRSLTIPVTGTVSRPTPDTRGLLQNIGQQQIQNRVNDQLDNGLNKLFDKLR
ncbi:MAG: hypothetical protein ABJZ55_06625 [Fuerstiella sp.]